MEKVYYPKLFTPTIKALHNLGGSASNDELEGEVKKILGLAEKEANEMHKDGRRTKLGYNLAWARTYLKKYGLIDNSSRGIWLLTEKGKKTKKVDKKEVINFLKKGSEKRSKTEEEILAEEETWEEKVLNIVQELHPAEFERLTKRFLRECGFVQVEVTGKPGDQGIDGLGVLKVGGIISFHVAFQCKRFKGSVSPGAVRDFRGAIVGRADKGIIITTGSFTNSAKKEARRAGATPIDLIDGEELARKFKELSLGIETKEKIVEEIEIDEDWFKKF